MNFAVESYNAVEQATVVEKVVPQFKPHGFLYIAHETEFEKTMGILANFVEDRVDLTYPELRSIVADADLKPGMTRTIALRRLNAHRDEVVGWAYRKIVADARAQGIQPIWAFIPMPVPGTGPCPPGYEQMFCFGNLSRAGAAADASDPRVNRLFELAREAGFVILDLSNVYGDTDLTSLWISKTDAHPNAAGHRVIAEGLYKALKANPEITRDHERVTTRSQD
jgi:hypothetical protein